MRPVTKDCFDSMMMDEWPGNAAICDFGLHTQQHYEAIYYPARAREITIEQLDEILGSGPKITELVRKCSSNPRKDITFKTLWSLIGGE